jgi:tetratricopeptide (TPR) repeat protein
MFQSTPPRRGRPSILGTSALYTRFNPRPQSRAIGILQNSDYSLSYLLFLAPLIVMHFIQEKAKTIKALFGVSALVVLLGLFVLLPEGLQSAIKAAPSYLIGYHHSEVQQSSTQASKQSDSSSSASSSDAFLDNSSNSMRFWAWKAGLEIGKKHFWTGSGAGTVQYFLPKIQQERPLSNWDDNVTTDNLHNEAIDYFATMGIFGLALYLLLWGSIFYFIIKGIKDKIPEKNILITLGSSLVLFLGFNQLLFTTIGTMFLPWTAAAIVLILTGRVAYRQKRELNFLPQVLLISVAVITSIILLIFSCRYWVAAYYFGKGIKYGNDFRLFNKSVSLFPYNERYWRYYSYYNYFYNLVTKEANLGKRLEPSERERVLNESIKSLKKSVELGPISWKDWSMYGTVLLAGKDLNPDNSSQAEAAFSKAAEMSPKNVPLTIQISNAYLNINDLDQAMKYTNLALDYSNSNSATKPQVYLSFGKIYLAQNNLEKSYEMFSKAKELNHGAVNAELQYYLSQFESHN